jgi:hypothetical protein
MELSMEDANRITEILNRREPFNLRLPCEFMRRFLQKSLLVQCRLKSTDEAIYLLLLLLAQHLSSTFLEVIIKFLSADMFAKGLVF